MEKDFSIQRVIGKTDLIGQILLKRGLITGEQLESVLNIQKKEGGLLGDILIKQGFISEESMSVALAIQFDLGYIPVERYKISKETLKLVPPDIVHKHCFVPLEAINGVLTIAMANPFDEEIIKEIQTVTHYKVVSLVGTKSQIERIIQANY